MKEFFKQVAAVVVGMISVMFLMGLMFFILLGAIVAAGSSQPELQKGSVLHLKLEGEIVERAEENPFDAFLSNTSAASQGLDEILTAIKVAATDKNVSGIYIEGGAVSADFASLQEIRRALTEFKKSGKFIMAYGDVYTQGAYYVASAADSVLVNPSGMIDWHGIASQPIFYKDLLEKIGVKMQVFRVGTYKSAIEPFILTEMSPANRAQVSSFVSDIWTSVCADVSASRKLSVDSLNAFADHYITLNDASVYVQKHLADRLTYMDEVRDRLRARAGVGKLNLVTPRELAKCKPAETGRDGQVAVYYAAGNIVDAESNGGLGGSAEIVGPKVVEDLDKLMNDDNVKAVVLRINSGGGSAYASEQIWRAVTQLKRKKPVVVSMGGMAASGGYYMSCAANRIIAEPTTLTGSIGIFGMIPDASGLLTEKLGLHFDVVKTNESSDFGTVSRPFNANESRAMQAHVERGYALFLKRVAEGRGMKASAVDSIAQGRVWTGRQALGIKLVDKLGTLDDAIAEAAALAKVKDYSITTSPAATDWMQKLMSDSKDGYMESRLRAALGEYYLPLSFVRGLHRTERIQARIPFEPNLY